VVENAMAPQHLRVPVGTTVTFSNPADNKAGHHAVSFWEAEFDDSDLNFAGWAKKLTGAVTITVGSVGLSGDFIAAYGGEGSKPASLDELLRRLDRGDFDLVAVGRALLQDPQWAVKVHQGRTEELMDFERSAMATLY